MKITNDVISDQEPMHFSIMGYDKNKFEQPHLLRADKVELTNNHLMFYLKEVIIFKVWLKEGRWESYKDIKEALKDSGIKLEYD